MTVKPGVRGAMIQRELDFAPVLEATTLPVLVTHGRADTVVLPAMADYILEALQNRKGLVVRRRRHAPFLEEPSRFNAELKEFVTNAYH